MILPNPRNCTLLFHSSSLSIMVGNRHTAKKKSIRKQWRSFEKLWTSSTPTWQAPTQFACPVAVVLIALHTKHVKLHLQVCYRLFGCPLCDFKDFAEVLFVRMWRPLFVYFVKFTSTSFGNSLGTCAKFNLFGRFNLVKTIWYSLLWVSSISPWLKITFLLSAYS
jgi:hypothetical protein